VLPFGIIENMVLDILFLFIGLMGFAGYFLISGDKRQALHDRVSHT